MASRTLLFVALVFSCANDFISSEKILKVENFELKCPGKGQMSVFFRNFQFTRNENGETLTNAIVEVKENLNGPIKLTIMVERCNKRDPSRCTKFRQMDDENYCETVASPANPLGAMCRSIKPTWKCPLRKGSYKLVNKTMDTKMAFMVLSESYYYKARAEMFDKKSGNQLMCSIGKISVGGF